MTLSEKEYKQIDKTAQQYAVAALIAENRTMFNEIYRATFQRLVEMKEQSKFVSSYEVKQNGQE